MTEKELFELLQVISDHQKNSSIFFGSCRVQQSAVLTDLKLLVRKGKAYSNEGYCLSYIHPCDLDAGQPMLEGLPATRKFKSYVGLKGSENKLRKYLTEFQFIDIATAEKQIDWEKVPVVKL